MPVRQYLVKVVHEYPHNRSYFTQGLLYHDGLIYEGTGLHGESRLVAYQLEQQAPLRSLRLQQQYFGEGITVFDGKVFQLTYKSGTGFVYDAATFQQLRTFSYKTQGWGITHDGRSLIMSDGSDTLLFLDPDDFAVKKKLIVRNSRRHQYGLNELEYIDGVIYANVWQTNRIVQIDPKSGQVVGEIDLSAIVERYRGDPDVDVLNGIAWDAQQQRLFITGKLWPHLYHVELIEQLPKK